MIQVFKRYKIYLILGLLFIAIQVILYFKLPLTSSSAHHSKSIKSRSHKDIKVKINSPAAHPQTSVIDDDFYQNNNTSSDNSNKDNSRKELKSNKKYLQGLNFIPKCDVSKNKETVSAVQRAKSQECKKQIIDLSCDIESGFYPTQLPNFCPSKNYIANRSLGCFKDEKKFRILSGYYNNYKESNSPKKCIQMCLQSGFLYAGVQYSTECFCGNSEPSPTLRLPDPNCNMKCPGDPKEACGGYFAINIYETGITKFSPQIAELNPKSSEKKVRIAFLLTLNGRALRQIYRLLKALYSSEHFYYIHIDSRQDYLYRELLKLESMFPNIRLSRKRFSTIWGGASLLQMLMSCMTDLLNSTWEWDFVLNLSESDFPVKTIDKLADFLTANKNKNFVKSHGREVQRFIQKQGLDKTFVECDTHMWRIGDRSLPSGIQIDGGSDWICLSRNFVEYVTNPEQDELITGLLKIFSHTLLPAESFFHTAIRNSKFCNSYLDNNLHITNWKRRLGCKCQYKHVVDWCGCSPNDFRTDDWLRLQATDQKQLFFGRKFEPIVNQMIVLQLEEWLFGTYSPDYINLNSYWQNVYHHKDKSPRPNPVLLTVANSLIRINSKSNQIQEFYEPLNILEITDYMDNDIYRGFLIKHEAKINENLTVELETWCRPAPLAQVSKTIKIASKIMQFDVSTDYDQKEQMSRNLGKIIGPHSEPVVILKLSGSSKSENTTVNFTVLWLDPNDTVVDSSDLHVEDFTVTSINFSKANLKHPLKSGSWTVKLLYKKQLIGHTKFLVTPLSEKVLHDNTKVVSKPNFSDNKTIFNNSVDKLVSNFYQIKDTCVIYSQNNIKNIIISYLNFDKDSNPVQNNLHKFIECKKTSWSSSVDDPKSDIFSSNDLLFYDRS